LVLGILGGVIVILTITSTVLYIDSTAPRSVRISSMHWSAIWHTNDSPATLPLGPGDWAGSCWNLTGSWLPSTQLSCDLEFYSGDWGRTPVNHQWSYLSNVTLTAPFVLEHLAVGYFGPQPGSILSTFVLRIQFPSSPGSYEFSGVLWVS